MRGRDKSWGRGGEEATRCFPEDKKHLPSFPITFFILRVDGILEISIGEWGCLITMWEESLGIWSSTRMSDVLAMDD